jgi:hypothetical protein
MRTAHRPPGFDVALLRERRLDRPDDHSANVGRLVLVCTAGTCRR